jgi:hypothetical protein
MDLYDRIRDKISGLTNTLKNMNKLTSNIYRDSEFSDLYIALEKRMKEGPSASAEVKNESKPAESAPTASNVSASNNRVAIGAFRSAGISVEIL